MVAKNMKELEQMLMNVMQQGVEAANQAVYKDLTDNLARFYTKGSPKMYERTGQLGMAGRSENAERHGNEVVASTYIDDTYQYTTGTHSTPEIISDAENHKAGILGEGHFWADTEKNIQNHLDTEIKKRFG